MPATPPLRWTRALIMVLLVGVSATATILGINILDIYEKTEDTSDLDIGISDSDIHILFIALVMCITFSVIIAIISFQILVVLFQDTFHRNTTIEGRRALSTTTLFYQFVVLGACTIFLTASLVTWTMFSVKWEIKHIFVFAGFSWSAVVLGFVGTLITLLAIRIRRTTPKPNIPEIIIWKPSMESDNSIPDLELKFDPGIVDMELIAHYLVAADYGYGA